MDYLAEYEVYGKKALFCDPIMRMSGQKMSYQVPTYSGLVGMTEAIYWKPTFFWRIESVRIMNQIICASEGKRVPHVQDAVNDLAKYMYLVDVRYQVRARMCWNLRRDEYAADRVFNKHKEIFEKSLSHGGRRSVYLGASECPGFVRPCVFGEGSSYYDDRGTHDFGIMVHSIVYPKDGHDGFDEDSRTKLLWRYVMQNGVIEFPRSEDCNLRKLIDK